MAPRITDIKAYIKARVTTTDECWLWTKAVCGGGNPKARVDQKTVSVRRLAYAEFIGPIPPGQFVNTSCENLLCLSPEHLQASAKAFRRPAPKGPCKNGHPYDPDDRYEGWCGPCRRIFNRSEHRRAYDREWYRTRRKKPATV